MLKDWNSGLLINEDELTERIAKARADLSARQMLIKDKKIPVLILFEGWGAAGKGNVIGKVIKNLDPRFFKIAVMDSPTSEEKRKPFLYRHFKNIPEAGQFTIFDGGWMKEVTQQFLEGNMDKDQYKQRIQSIRRFERQLTDNGYLVLKFFFHISKKEQQKRIDKLLNSKSTKWRVSKSDLKENDHYNTYLKIYDHYLEETNHFSAPWYLIDSTNRKLAELQVLEYMIAGIDTTLMNDKTAVPLLQNAFPLVNMPKLSTIDVNQFITEEDYRKELKACQRKLRKLHNELYRRKIPVVIAYEGWDAAGKGGNIKRIASALDPRGYTVHPIASPEPHEKARHFLWRFWTRLPKDGHIAIFDRTWYGRVMVERLEGFCSTNDWQRAYNEINEFEKELDDWGAIVIKFFVHIDKDTQLERFTLRQNTPEKQWKITDEDWRNREKWDQYEDAIDEMIQKTSTTYAPWYILESNDKKYARIKALKIIIQAIEERINQ